MAGSGRKPEGPRYEPGAFGRDLRHGVRLFLRQPGTTSLAVITLSLGIGANTVIFSLVHAILLRPLPFPAVDRLVSVNDRFLTEGAGTTGPTVPELIDLRSRSRLLEAVSFYDMRDVQINGGTEPARAFAARIEGSFLRVLGARPALGRLFVEADNAAGRDRVVILTDGFWRRNFGADPQIVGREIIVNGVPNTVVGVLPAGFHFDYLSAEPIELYVPFPMNPAYTSRSSEFANVRRVFAVARLRTSVTSAQASSELKAISQAVAAEHPALYKRGSDGRDLGFVMDVEPIGRAVAAGRPVLLLLSAAVGLVLLIACVNTAQFLLARAVERQQEVAVRTALGASRGRLVRQFLSEALVLAAAAAALGIVQARWVLDLLRGPLEIRARLMGGIGIDGAVLAFTIAVAFVTTLTFGLLPALRYSQAPTLGTLDLRGGGVVRTWTRQAMIAFQVAISIVLLISAAVVLRGLMQLQRAPSGYVGDDVTVMRLRASPRGTGNGPTGPLYQRYLERLSAVPGIRSAAFADAPLAGFAGVEFSIVGRADDAATLSRQRASWRIVSPEYFAVLGIPILEGRSFTDGDVSGRPVVAIINEEMARQFWPGQSPIGQQIKSGIGPRATVATIVGVVGNVRPPLQFGNAPQMYVSYRQQSEPSITLLVRSLPEAPVPLAAVKQAIWSVQPDQPVFDIHPLSDVLARSMAQPRLIAQFLGGFAALALLMSIMGVYMVVTYLTSRRAREVALRRAIGADSVAVFTLLAGQTMRWTLVGLASGIAGAVAARGALRAVLVGIAGLDWWTVSVVGVLYLGVVAVAVAVPAARALRLDPATLLRAE